MNFVGPGDFQFVTGDLSSITIDNDIMPTRSGGAKYNIRGMDVAFLMEAVEERARALNMSGKSFDFDRSITASQINQIIRRCNEIVDRQNADKWLNDYLYFSAGDVTDLGDFEKFPNSGTFHWSRYNYVAPAKIEEVAGLSISSGKILDLFDFVQSLNRIITNEEFYDYSGRTYTATGTPEAIAYALKSYNEPELWREIDTGAIGGRVEFTATGQNLKLMTTKKSVYCGDYVQGKLSMCFACSWLEEYAYLYHAVEIDKDGTIPFLSQESGMNYIKHERITNDFCLPYYSRPIYELRDRTRWD